MHNTIDYWCSTCGKPISEPTSVAESNLCSYCRKWWNAQDDHLGNLSNLLEYIHKRTKKKEAMNKRWEKRRSKCRQQKHKKQSKISSITWEV